MSLADVGTAAGRFLALARLIEGDGNGREPTKELADTLDRDAEGLVWLVRLVGGLDGCCCCC